jgi:hypothetical protein
MSAIRPIATKFRIVGAPAAFALLPSANGILTIARGTLPLVIFGPENYA